MPIANRRRNADASSSRDGQVRTCPPPSSLQPRKRIYNFNREAHDIQFQGNILVSHPRQGWIRLRLKDTGQVFDRTQHARAWVVNDNVGPPLGLPSHARRPLETPPWPEDPERKRQRLRKLQEEGRLNKVQEFESLERVNHQWHYMFK